MITTRRNSERTVTTVANFEDIIRKSSATTRAMDEYDVSEQVENEQAKAGDSFIFYNEIIRDGKWHVLVVDVSKYENETIIPEEDGTYKLKYVRFDPINGTNDINYRVDIAYFAIHNNLDEIIEFNAEEGEIHLVEGFGNVTVIPTK